MKIQGKLYLGVDLVKYLVVVEQCDFHCVSFGHEFARRVCVCVLSLRRLKATALLLNPVLLLKYEFCS